MLAHRFILAEPAALILTYQHQFFRSAHDKPPPIFSTGAETLAPDCAKRRINQMKVIGTVAWQPLRCRA